MAYYGYIRTSKELEADRRGMDPETQRRALIAAGVPERQVYDDIDVSGIAGVASRNGWRALDAKLQRGDTLAVAALDRVGRSSSPPSPAAWASRREAALAPVSLPSLLHQLCRAGLRLSRQPVALTTPPCF